MDPKTLRIGNTIRKTQSEIWQKKHRGALTTVTSWELQVLEKNANEGYYEGVPLTPELLLEYGFTKNSSESYSHIATGWQIEQAFYGHWFIIEEELTVSLPLDYLHELQNAIYFLEGAELEKAPAPEINYTQPSLF